MTWRPSPRPSPVRAHSCAGTSISLVAAVPASRLSALALPPIVAALDQQPLDVQQALVDDAAARLAPPPEPRAAQRRAVAARAKTTGYVGPASTPGTPGTAPRTAAPVSRPLPTPLDARHARIAGTGPSRAAPRASR